MNESVTKQLVFQRIRNRIIDNLELFSDSDAYKIAINNLEFWADWVDSKKINEFEPPVFSRDEVKEIFKVNLAWESVELDSSQESKEWISFSRVAKQALQVFMQRGKLSENIENA